MSPKKVQLVILAAGMGSRLGRELPKSLTELDNGRSIMQQQFDNIEQVYGKHAAITVVVGYRAEEIVDRFGDRARFVYNERFDQTNTSKSLLRALRASSNGGVLWMNGDVVFDAEILERGRPYVTADRSYVTVNTSKVADEEVKYTIDADGYIDELSKTVRGGLGEAVGINYISSHEKSALLHHLGRVEAQDYFERGLELAIERDRLRIEPLDISDLNAVEVDFAEDLDRANAIFA